MKIWGHGNTYVLIGPRNVQVQSYTALSLLGCHFEQDCKVVTRGSLSRMVVQFEILLT